MIIAFTPQPLTHRRRRREREQWIRAVTDGLWNIAFGLNLTSSGSEKHAERLSQERRRFGAYSFRGRLFLKKKPDFTNPISWQRSTSACPPEDGGDCSEQNLKTQPQRHFIDIL